MVLERCRGSDPTGDKCQAKSSKVILNKEQSGVYDMPSIEPQGAEWVGGRVGTRRQAIAVIWVSSNGSVQAQAGSSVDCLPRDLHFLPKEGSFRNLEVSLGSLSSPMGLLPSPFISLAACLLLARKPSKKAVQSTQENGQVMEGSVAAQETKAQGTGGHEKQLSPASPRDGGRA